MVVFINPITRQKEVIVNDKEKLLAYYNGHKNEIFVGYNSRNYDQYILKGILCGFDPFEITKHIIGEDKPGWRFSNLMRKFPLINYDVMPNPPVGLKTLEGFMGNDIRETSVPFDIDRKLTQSEIEETIKYCTHDVEQTIEVFMERKSEFDAMVDLCKAFDLPLSDIGKTEAAITAKVLDCRMTKWKDEFDYFFLPCIKLTKYRFVMDWFKNAVNDCTDEMKKLRSEALENYNNATASNMKQKYKKLLEKYDWKDNESWSKHFYSRSLTVNVANVPHTFGFGGLHGASDTPVHKKGLLLHVDVGSYYPSMLIAWDLVTRTAQHPEKYTEVYDTRMALKKAGKKKEQAPYKKLLNSLSGAMKDALNPAYDPRNNNIMCINGQLMLLDLIEKLEAVKGFELIQSNTDGLIIYIPSTQEAFNQVDDICYDWESRCSTDKCSILLGLDVIDEIYQGDVNNYLWIDGGKGERKGAYVKELSRIDYDLPIINKAIVEYLMNKTPVETTINKCDDLIEFQKLVKLSSNYKWVEWNGEKYTYKCYRVFASKKPKGKIFKCGGSRGNPEKFANTPDNCFIFNDDVNGVKCPNELDKNWYVNLAKQRLKDKFGVIN